MINQKDILAALQGGADAEKLANDFADALNAAIAEKQAADAAKREAEAKKVSRLETILTETISFIKDYYPDLYLDGMEDCIDAAAALKILDEGYAEIQKTTPALNEIESFLKELGIEESRPRGRRAKAFTLDELIDKDPIADFLKKNNL